jgi:hypothetical protein
MSIQMDTGTVVAVAKRFLAPDGRIARVGSA